jgi:hypothetical protein
MLYSVHKTKENSEEIVVSKRSTLYVGCCLPALFVKNDTANTQ